jgi:TolB-like protein
MFFRRAKRLLCTLLICLSAAPAQQSSVITVAVIDFEQEGLSQLEVQTLTQRFISELEKTAKAILFDDGVVKSQIQAAGYELNACKKADCVVTAIGDSLGMQYIITGAIKKNDDRYRLEAFLTDVVTGKAERVINTNYSGPVDGMITELEIMAWEIMDQDPPESLVEKRKGKTKKKIKRPNAKTSFGALARATVIPGWGHRYLGQKNKSYAFFGFETAALTFGYLFYNDYKSAYDDVDKYWSKYKRSTDHDLLQEYRAKTLEAEQVMIDNNNNLTLFFRMAGVIHVINMLDAYMTEIAPQGIAEKTQIELGYDPIIQQPQLRFSIALD